MLYLLLKRVLVGPLVRGLTRPVVSGSANVPRRGPAILAANHLAEVDSLVLALVVRRRIRFLAKAEYFGRGASGRGSLLYGWLCRATAQIPVDRAGGAASLGALRSARAVVSSGGVWAIYPEGTRSPDGRVHRGHTGVMRVAVATGAPVVPVGIAGTDRGRAGRRGRVTVRIGEPIDPSRYPDDPAGWRAGTDDLMARLAALSGRDYVDVHAPRAR